jgi:ELWxxDGT repeat protein
LSINFSFCTLATGNWALFSIVNKESKQLKFFAESLTRLGKQKVVVNTINADNINLKAIIFFFSGIFFTYTAHSQSYFFAANDGKGTELWISDGTKSGTKMVANINTTDFGRASSNPSQFTVLGKILFFTADDGKHGVELWQSDGTEEGTKLVTDINKNNYGKASSNPSQLKVVGNKLFFTATNSSNRIELWESDGTDNGTKLVKGF